MNYSGIINLIYPFSVFGKKVGIEMTLQQLRYAVMVSDCKSMNKAAEKLFITQPSLSGTIKDLEKEINVNLFIL